jgi:hypothetical protein
MFDLVKTVFKKNIENKMIVYNSLFDLKITNTQFILFLKTENGIANKTQYLLISLNQIIRKIV